MSAEQTDTAALVERVTNGIGSFHEAEVHDARAALAALEAALVRAERWARAERSGRKQERSRADAAEARAQKAEAVVQAAREVAVTEADAFIGWEPSGERAKAIDRAFTSLYAALAALDAQEQAERCPVCEGLDQPGLMHNPRAAYCSQEQRPDERDREALDRHCVEGC